MKSYYYMDCLHREIFLEEEDIQAVPESGRADEACSAIAGKPYVVEQFMADSFRTLKNAASRLCDSPDVKSRHDALMYIVWTAALDIRERRTLRHGEAAVKVPVKTVSCGCLYRRKMPGSYGRRMSLPCIGFMLMIRNP